MAAVLARTAHGVERPIAALLVDRDDDTRAMYTEYLRAAGLRVDEAHDGREALAKALAARPDVIVTATRLPGISGLDLCKVLRRDPTTAEVPVVFVTGDTTEADVRKALAAGASRVLVKPCLPDKLLQEIQRLLINLRTVRDESAALCAHSVAEGGTSRTLRAESATQRRVMLNHVHRREVTSAPTSPAPGLVCPNCYQPLHYVKSYLGGVSDRHPEQWDYFECQTGCGTFQYRHRTRKLRQIS